MSFQGPAETQPGLKTGVIWQDHHHQTLFEYFKKLDQACQAKNPDRITHLLEEILTFARGHFEVEELYMAEMGFTEFDSHKRVHEAFLQVLGKAIPLRGNAAKVQALAGEKLFKELQETPTSLPEIMRIWLQRHIQQQDGLLAAFLLRHARG